MKKSEKILFFLIFLLLNGLFIYVISTFFNVGYGVLAISFITIIASVDISKRINNAKILKAQREILQKQANIRNQEIQNKKQNKNRAKKMLLKNKN